MDVLKNWRDNLLFLVFVGFLLLVFATGGGARADVQSLFILRSAAALACFFALYSLRWEHVKANRFLFAMAAAIIALVGLHLIPFPAALWHSMAGRELIVEIDKTVGLGDVSRPLATVPHAAWNALYALLVPLAALLLGVQLQRAQRAMLLPLLLAVGMASGLIGLLQAIGDPKGPLYLYAVTNNGSAVGLYANRNHQAALLAVLFPMFAVYACASIRSDDQAKIRSILAICAAALLVPLMLVTGSRAGVALGLVGLVGCAALYRKPDFAAPARRRGSHSSKVNWKYLAIGFGVFLLAATTIVMSRAESINRLLESDPQQEQRFAVWPVIADIGNKFSPWGSGIGSFVEVFQVYEPKSELDSTYMNHAHNDWLEVWMTAGIPGILLLALAVIGFLITAWKAIRANSKDGSHVIMARLGALIVLMLGLASIADYPLRTPSLACVFVIAALWMHGFDDNNRNL